MKDLLYSLQWATRNLSSMLALFRRVGFRLCGNVVWDKGDIEGKRAFNSGNYSPYYQSPFNCWEHILVFGKPEDRANAKEKSLLRYPAYFGLSL